MVRWILGASGIVAAFGVVTWVTRPHPPSTKAVVEDVSCHYFGTDDDGAHLYRVKARGTAAGPADISVTVDTEELGFPMPAECIQWGRACYRDPSEGKKTEWSGQLEFGTSATPYTLTVRAKTQGSYVTAGRNAPKIDVSSKQVVCDTPSEPVVAQGNSDDE